MFIGAINRHTRAVVEQAAEGWKGLPVYVALHVRQFHGFDKFFGEVSVEDGRGHVG